jgi:hypothetical protein
MLNREPCVIHGLTGNCKSLLEKVKQPDRRYHCPPTGGWEDIQVEGEPGDLPTTIIVWNLPG